MTFLLGIAAYLLLPLIGIGVCRLDGVRRLALDARIAIAGATGALIVALTLLAMSAAGVTWSRTILFLIFAAIAAAGAYKLKVRSDEPRSPFTAARAAIVVVLAITAYGLTTARETCGDLLFIWGPKAVHFFRAGRIDFAYLIDPVNFLAHRDYPPLVPLVFAWSNALSHQFSWWAALFFGGLCLLAIVAIVRGGTRNDFSGLLTVAVLAYVFAVVRVAGAADPLLLLFEAVTVGALLFIDEPRAQTLVAAIGVAGVVLTKVEGVSFVVALLLAFLITRTRDAKRLLAIVLPGALLIAGWIAVMSRHNMIDTYHGAGPLNLKWIGSVVVGTLSSASYGCYGIVWFAPLIVILLGDIRRALLPLTIAILTFGATIFFYLHGSDNPAAFWILSSAQRVLLTPLLMTLFAAAAAQMEPGTRTLRWKPDRWFVAYAAVIVFTLIRVAATQQVFSPTFDEGCHIAGGHEYLTEATYLVDPQHPPLSRIFFALPFVDSGPLPGNMIDRGNAILERGGDLRHSITHARRGNLLFLLIGLVAVVLWARHLFGDAVALITLIFFASLEPLLAHAGLATTDMSGAAAMPLALYALTLFLELPTWRRTLLLGIAFGFGLVTKFSFLPFFAATAVALFIIKRRLPIVRGVVAMALGLLLTWATYGFSFAPMGKVNPHAIEITNELYHSSRLANVPLPAPMFFAGILEVKLHDVHGHQAYLFGRESEHGWWYYFPVALLFKTPLPFLALFALGAWMLGRRQRAIELPLFAILILGVAMTSGINIGVRHLLPMYAPMSIAAAFAAVEIWRLQGRIAVGLLAGWLVVGSLLAHPDYLPWMNGLALGHPERVLVDSNLDWGQDLFRLATQCRKRHITSLGTALFTTAHYPALGFPPTDELQWYMPRSGWSAISETVLQEARAREPLAFQWLIFGRDYIRVGKSVRLYFVR